MLQTVAHVSAMLWHCTCCCCRGQPYLKVVYKVSPLVALQDSLHQALGCKQGLVAGS
jgi:hypothetical protein